MDYQLTLTLKSTDLITFCEQHIQKQYTKMILIGNVFEMQREEINHILKLDTFQCDEVDLFNVCKRIMLKNGWE